MNEIAGGGKLLRLRYQGPTSCDWGRPPPVPPSSLYRNPNSPGTTPRQKAFFHSLIATPIGTAPSPLLLPLSTSSHFLFNYGRASPFLCSGSTDVAEPEPPELQPRAVDCVGTGSDVECVVHVPPSDSQKSSSSSSWWELAVLVSPFFFWGTAMVAMKPVLPKTGPLFVSAFRLIPAGLLLVAFAASQRRRPPSGLQAWLSISLFALVDASCFQGFLAEGLQGTPAGLGSVIIDSQPLTVAVLAALLFGESVGFIGGVGIILGIVGLLLLEVPGGAIEGGSFSLWGSGEWWMLLAAQSMAVGTVMVRWVTKYSDPVMATGWHMIIGGVPLLAISFLYHDPVFAGQMELSGSDILSLLYTSIFGSAISYGVYFYSATKGSLTKLSSLTFLTPMFASLFGYLYLDENFSSLQWVGALITLFAIYLINYENSSN
ncbi:hypothetical protein MLD38_040715 [Melastoma candidum]|nr:hypothetical protein MLD38_040715 [Melastoma candidum]